MRWLTVCLISIACIASSHAQAATPKRVLILCQGPDGHPAGSHEFIAGARILEACLKAQPDIEVRVVQADDPWPRGPLELAETDAAVLYLAEGAKWIDRDEARKQAFQDLAARKGGLAALHWAIGTKSAEPIGGFVKLFGGCHGGPDRKYRVLETRLDFPAEPHPISQGIAPFDIKDEFYFRLKFAEAPHGPQPVVRALIDQQPETVAWAWDRADGGRSFGFSGLHFHENWRRVEYRRLTTQGILWTLKLPIAKEGVAVDVPAELLTRIEK